MPLLREKRASDVTHLKTFVRHIDGDRAFVLSTKDTYDYYPAVATEPDDLIVVKPNNVSGAGRWIKRVMTAADFTIGDGSVDTQHLADLAVTGAKIDVEAITADKFAPAAGVLLNPGTCAVNMLVLLIDVAEEATVTIGDDVYEVEIVNTDSTDDTDNGDFDEAEDNIVISAAAYPGTTWAVGVLVRVEDEILRVISKDGDVVTLARGDSGTTPAAHADAQNIYKGDGVTAGRIAVGLVASLLGTDFGWALAAVINQYATEAVEATIGDMLILKSTVVGEVELPCSTTLDAPNVWAAATTYGGVAPSTKKVVTASRVPNAAEATLGTMAFHFDAPVAALLGVTMRTTSNGKHVPWGGDAYIGDGGNTVLLVNNTNPDFAVTNTMSIVAVLA